MKKLIIIVALSLASALFLVGCESLPEGSRSDSSMPDYSGGHHH
ncbi:MAG: hypothetical protein WC661_01905 [Opitutaceae bacterium]|jgi:hypothetical protein